MLRRGPLVVVVAFGVHAAAPRARAAEVRTVSRTIGEGYSIRVPDGDGTLLTRRRVVQYVDLGVFDLLPPRRVDEAFRRPEDGQLRIVTSLRLRHDFGSVRSEATGRAGSLLDSNDGRQIDLLFGYLEGESLARWVDVRAGRQFEASGLDWYVFDGGWLRVRTPAHVAVEAFSGFDVDGSALFGYPTHELDGTQGTPADRALSPMVGGAVSTTDLRWLDARVAYRRTFSPAVLNRDVALDDGSVGLADGVDQELVGATAALRLFGGRLAPFSALRVNLATARVDDAAAGVQWALTERHLVRAQWIRTIPAFDLDSIFNVFSSTPFEEARAIYQVRPGPGWTLAARGQARVFRAEPIEEPDAAPDRSSSLGLGGGLTAHRQARRSSIRVDGFGMGGEGGVRAGGSIDTRTHVRWDRVALDGRAYGVYYADDQLEAREGFSVSVQAGVNLRLFRGIHLNVVGEETVSSRLATAFRALGVLTVDWSFRGGRR